MIKRIIAKIKSGMLKDIVAETRWIYNYASSYKNGILLYIVLGIASTCIGLGASVASKYLIDAVTGHKTGVIVSTACMYVGFNIAKLVMSALIKRVSARFGVKISNEIRADVFSRFLDVDWQASLDYHSGDLLSRISSDVTVVAESVLGWIPSLVTSLFQFVAILIVMLIYDPVMALIALVSSPVTIALSRYFVVKLRSFGKKVRESQAAMLSFYEESLQNLQAVKAFRLNGSFSGRLGELQSLYRGLALDYNLFSVKTGLIMNFMALVVSCLCLAWGVYRLWDGRISYGTMILFIQLAGYLSSSFSSLVGLIPSAINSTVSAGRIMAVLDLPAESITPTDAEEKLISSANADGVTVKVDNAVFTYKNGRRVFSGLSLSAAPGEIIGIVSPSGGGKTTLVRMLLGLISPESGAVLLEAGGVTAEMSPALRVLTTYVAQEKVIFSGTVADCLRISKPDADDTELEAALKAACAYDFVAALPDGLNTVLGEKGSGLSEGQIQRLAIARAVLSDAPLMLLDEATSALDMETEKQVLKNLLSDTNGRTVIITTHRPTVLSECARVYSINGGRAELLSDEAVKKMLFGR